MTALEHSARVAYARQALAETDRPPADLDREQLAIDRGKLRAALSMVLEYADELLAIIEEQVQP